MQDAARKIKRLERQYASNSVPGLISSGLRMLRARRITRPGTKNDLNTFIDDVTQLGLFTGLIAVPAFLLSAYQSVYRAVTSKDTPAGHPYGAWQWALHFSLREDLAHHTVETVGYHIERPSDATHIDDLAAWVMTLIQFLWSYEELMGVIWDEWTLVRLVAEGAAEAGLSDTELFYRLPRQWEVARPYNAPLNGTYADVRRGRFETFITPRLNRLPPEIRSSVHAKYVRLRETERRSYQKQMSLLRRMRPGPFHDEKETIPLWDASVALVINGRYHIIPIAVRNEEGYPLVFGRDGRHQRLILKDGKPFSEDGEELTLVDDQVFRLRDGERIGYLDMAPFHAVKWQVRAILEREKDATPEDYDEVDILLAETPRAQQQKLRRLLSERTQAELEKLRSAAVILNWDEQPREDVSGELRPLAQLRRVQRGIGDHPLTVMRTRGSYVFDQHHIFFDGVWSLAMAEVLTNSAIAWCTRGLSIAPSNAAKTEPLGLHASAAFLETARPLKGPPEISAETTIHDIMTILDLRRRLKPVGARLTVNDLLVTARIFHAVNYEPGPKVREAIEQFEKEVRTPAEHRALEILRKSLKRGVMVSPSLGIPVDASAADPSQRIYLLTFRNTLESVVWAWDDAWNAYQNYRRIEPPDTPEGIAAYREFDQRRIDLIAGLRDFSYLLDASKRVALRGESFSIAVFRLLANLPPWLQFALRYIPEQVPPLNEIIRGDEVYSNIGRVAPGSSLSRFITAKDDGQAKNIVWGIMTNDQGKMVVTMRDFRPHVAPLVKVGRIELARMLAQDYVVAYTNDLLGLVARLTAMLLVSAPVDDVQPAETETAAP